MTDARENGSTIRIHQEDCCQALSRSPSRKYQNEGGPSAKEIFKLIRSHSSDPSQDALRFLNALIFITSSSAPMPTRRTTASSSQGIPSPACPSLRPLLCTRLPREIPLRRARLAMKIGGTYQLHHIGSREWSKAATEWKLSEELIRDQILTMAQQLPHAARTTAQKFPDNRFIHNLANSISERAEEVQRHFHPL